MAFEVRRHTIAGNGEVVLTGRPGVLVRTIRHTGRGLWSALRPASA